MGTTIRPRLDLRFGIAILAAAGIVASALTIRNAASADSAGTAHPIVNAADDNPQCVPDSVTGECIPPPADAYWLDSSVADQIKEPPSIGIDSAGTAFSDSYMAYYCGPGATAVALSYWPGTNVLRHGSVTMTDPQLSGSNKSLTWNDTNGRAYIAYLATQSQPTGDHKGELTYPSATAADTSNEAVVDTLNWEASGHASTWKSFFYQVTYANQQANAVMNLGTLKAMISHVIGSEHKPVVVAVNDAYLPDWKQSSALPGSHLVTVTGYDNTASTPTFTYVETCTTQSCGTIQENGSPNTDGTGTHTISQQDLLKALINNSYTGGEAAKAPGSTDDSPGSGQEGAVIW